MSHASVATGAGVEYRRSAADRALPPHLVELEPDAWALWRSVTLRSAGFPVDLVLTLADSACARAADRWAEACRAVQRAREDAAEAMRCEVQSATDPDVRLVLIRASRRLHRQPRLDVSDLPERPRAAVARLSETAALADAARVALNAAFDAARRRSGDALRGIARDARFREALLWQNRHAYLTGLARLLQTGAVSREERLHRLVVRYVQRYCTKNETIGFFGPIGAATWAPDGALTVRPGTALVRSRAVGFEAWAIEALASRIADDPGVQSWLPPRRLSTVHVEEQAVLTPGNGRSELTPAQSLAMHAIDGRRAAKAIAEDLCARSPEVFASSDAVYSALQWLCARGWIAWGFEIPLDPVPETRLRECIESIGESASRASATRILDRMEQRRREVAAAAGDPDRLDAALGELSSTFHEITGAAPTRAAGRSYAARTIVYEDCCRDVELRLGPPLLAALAPPLRLLLQSARALTFDIARVYRQAFAETYAALAGPSRSPVTAVDFWARVQPLLFGERTCLARPIIASFRARWADLIGLRPDVRRMHCRTEHLAPLVARFFRADHAGWQSASYHSPDVLVAASDVDAVARGEFELVLGEFHAALNTLTSALFARNHPTPDQLFDWLEWDITAPRVVPVLGKHSPRETARMRQVLFCSQDVRLECTADPSEPSRAATRPISEFVMEPWADGIVAVTRDREMRFDAVEFFGETLSRVVAGQFGWLPAAAHVPRVTLDRLVMVRESWTCPARRLDFVATRGADRFAQVRAWAREQGMPRFVFVRSPAEVKPIFVDFESPYLVDLLARLAGAAREAPADELLITEMYPTPEQAWLADAAGRRYTSELRLIALDLATRAHFKRGGHHECV